MIRNITRNNYVNDEWDQRYSVSWTHNYFRIVSATIDETKAFESGVNLAFCVRGWWICGSKRNEEGGGADEFEHGYEHDDISRSKILCSIVNDQMWIFGSKKASNSRWAKLNCLKFAANRCYCSCLGKSPLIRRIECLDFASHVLVRNSM